MSSNQNNQTTECQMTECQKTECIRCGCSAEKDAYGDRICYCDTCKVLGGCFIVKLAQKQQEKPGCLRCGCSKMRDDYGDRVCFCDTCQNAGCILRMHRNSECDICDEMMKNYNEIVAEAAIIQPQQQ